MTLSLVNAAVAALSLFSACTVPTAAPGGKKNVVYYTNWSIYDRQFNPQDLPSNKITHVLHSFANVQADGTVFLSDPWADIQKQFSTDTAETGTNVYGIMKQLYLLKKSNRKLKVQLSIGGASFSANFPTAASTVANRERFAKSAVKLVADLGLDGLDIDWEFPTTKAEGDNYVSLLKAVRVELDAYSKKSASCYRFLLTIAASAGPATYAIQPLAALAKTVDWFNLMAYDYSGSWSGTAAHQANLYKSNDTLVTPFSTKAAVDAYLATGVAAKQIVLGMPIYGRAFSNTAGLGKPFSGQPAGTWGEAGVYDYKVLPRPGALEFTDAASGATYSYDATKKELVTYDTPEMVRAKVVWAKNKQLGGSMFWEASADKTGDKSLIAKSAGEWGNAALDGSVNQLEYPESVYANLKAGMV
ncbi:glycoside hydrolase family 18 protein [Schizothecium vesticola]|uniref:chitinase n=1 Tax=Schizothecium vesticola TaxID=314040 RepID=A0AA40EX19_9PEZI|nr:glycoside hydrolase family 18 protein [Schizothecium vesticola]